MKTILTLIAAAAALAFTTGTTTAATHTGVEAQTAGYCKVYTVRVKCNCVWVTKYYGSNYHSAKSVYYKYRSMGYQVKLFS